MTSHSERRFRRLILAYPAGYRRRHGDEMVTTLLDLEADGQPTRWESLHLIACGLRQRFRLPARRPHIWLAALLAAVAVGVTGAAAGTWLGWQAADPLPSADHTRSLLADLSGGVTEMWTETSTSAMGGPSVASRNDGVGDYSAARIRATLTADGWRITSLSESTPAYLAIPMRRAVQSVGSLAWADPPARIEAAEVRFAAARDGLKLTGEGWVFDASADYRLDIWPREPGVVRPLTVAGLIAGAIAGWLLTAAIAYRVRRGSRRRRWAATGLAVASVAALAVPVYRLGFNGYQVLAYRTGSPPPYVVPGPADDISLVVLLTCAVVGLLAVAAMLGLARARP